MRFSKLYIVLALLVVIASCSKSEDLESGLRTEGKAVCISVGTRADGSSSTRYSGSSLGFFIDYGNGNSGTKSNVRWDNDGSGKWTPESQVLWGKLSDKASVYAYTPYLEGQTDASAVNFTIPSDQSEGLGAADLLWWYPGIEDGAKKEVSAGDFQDGRIDIAFRHALVKLMVNFKLGTQFEGKNISIKEAWFHGSVDKVGIYFTGSESGGIPYVGMGNISAEAYSIKMHNSSADGNLSCEVLFFPYPALEVNTKLLTVTLSDGRDYTLTLDKNLDFNRHEFGAYVVGTSYDMTVNVGKDKLEMDTVTVADWNDKGCVGDDFNTEATEYSEWGGPEDVATEYDGGEGTEENPYQIATAAQLALMANEANNGIYNNQVTYFTLKSNIDLMGEKWTPIGNASNPFTGIFKGVGHTILNLKVTDNQYAGLFGKCDKQARIIDLKIRNASVKSKTLDKYTAGASGIVAAYCTEKSSIIKCSVEGSSVGNCYVGGIAGYIESGTISECTAEVSCQAESGSDTWCGGIAGYSSANVENCTVMGDIKGTMDVGGFVGAMAGGMIKMSIPWDPRCSWADVTLYAVCDPAASGQEYNVGGLVGKCCGDTPVEVGTPVYGNVYVASGLDIQGSVINLGGYIGYAEETHMAGNFLGSVEVGTLTGGTLNAGAFVGYLGKGVTSTYCRYYKSQVGNLPVYGAKADDADDSGLNVTTY